MLRSSMPKTTYLIRNALGYLCRGRFAFMLIILGYCATMLLSLLRRYCMGKRMYYYTDFNTFKLILQNGTLRFKESTCSNDKLDTVKLYQNLLEMAEHEIEKNSNLGQEEKIFFDMVKHSEYDGGRYNLVVCFTEKKDSRLLWDAYTMHRKDRQALKYNGVCIEFNKKHFVDLLKLVKGFDINCYHKVVYGFQHIDTLIEEYVQEYSEEFKKLSNDADQKQSIVKPIIVKELNLKVDLKKCFVFPALKLLNKIDSTAPFFKHEFWHEEKEIRALLSTNKDSDFGKTINKCQDGSAYFDLTIDKECISKVILGPEFGDDEMKEIESIECKIPFKELSTEPSLGTDVITNR